MRFCMVTTFYPPYHFGGDATYVRALSRALVEHGHTVEVIHCEDAFRIAGGETTALKPVVDAGIVVHRLKSRFGALSPIVTQQTGAPGLKASELRRVLDQNFDVVNFHNISLIGGPAILALSKAPVTLYTLHEHWLLCPTHIFWKNREKACESNQCIQCSIRSGIPPQWWRYSNRIEAMAVHVNAFLAPSKFTANCHQEIGLAPIHVLPLFSTLAPPKAPSIQLTENPTFLFVGRVTASKGIAALLNLFSKLVNYNLIVVGDGDLLSNLKEQYAGKDHIHFAGKVAQDALVHFYSNATALLFPSLAPETFGLSIVEAFACGTPAIVRDAGGSREIIDATGGGVVYNNDEELLSALHRMARDDDWRSALALRARAGFERYYTQAHHIESYLDRVRTIQQTKGIEAT